MTSLSNCDRFGFMADEIYPFLERNGIKLARPDGTSTPLIEHSEAADFPEWKRVMAAHPDLSVDDIAHAFANIDPYATGWRSDDEDAEIARYRSLISRAIQSDAECFEAEPTEFDRDNKPIDWVVKHKELASWCAWKGLPYPLPRAAAIPATNAAALAEIERLKGETGRLKAELKEAKDGEVAADHPNYPPELDIAMTAWRAAIVGWKKTPANPHVSTSQVGCAPVTPTCGMSRSSVSARSRTGTKIRAVSDACKNRLPISIPCRIRMTLPFLHELARLFQLEPGGK